MKLSVNPPYGQKSGFRKISVMLPADQYEWLAKELARRKIAGAANHTASAIVRELLDIVLDVLKKLDEK